MPSARQWVTTAPNPRTRAVGFDANQRGWKLHAIAAPATAKFSDVRFHVAACGLLPNHGWALDLFIEDKCSRCERAVSKAEAAR